MNQAAKKMVIAGLLTWALNALDALRQKLEDLSEDDIADKVDDIRKQLRDVVKPKTE